MNQAFKIFSTIFLKEMICYQAKCIPNPCGPNPCKNGGACTVIDYKNNIYLCNCNGTGYAGKLRKINFSKK